ncbi:bifunctional 5,10-methylenetetrahydrofolate dehydrogenase/5,10-methenyltetrahydrofolate cyclohydrolase [Nanoarchaeota archaeon]
MVTIIDGKAVAKGIRKAIKAGTKRLKEEQDITPGLVTILVGEDPGSATYVRMKKKTAKRLGFYSGNVSEDKEDDVKFPADIPHDELKKIIEGHNDNDRIHGILVQLPLPKQIDTYDIMDAVNPSKDVDGFSAKTTTDICRGDEVYLPPCTPQGVIELLKAYEIETQGQHVVVLGRSNIVGRPLANLLSRKEYSATVTVCHSRTKDLEYHCRQADILVAAIGMPKFVGPTMVKEGAVVIDVGTNRLEDDSLCGDVDFDEVQHMCSHITPSPGGVGPMTIAMLMKNTYNAAVGIHGLRPDYELK